MKNNLRKSIAWIDLLRIFACFLVIISHSCDPFVGKFDMNDGEFITGVLIGSFVRCCVPLFVIISGTLLLPIKEDLPQFYSKRTKRLLVPFIFWSLCLPFIYYIYINSGIIEIINPNIIKSDYTLLRTFEKMYLFVFNFNYDTTPLWYLYMLIGLYLFMPIISAWLKQAQKKEIKVFLFIWSITMCLPYIKMLAIYLGYNGNFGNTDLLGICDWNAYGMFYYFSGFLGYVVLAYYLKKYPIEWNWIKTLSVTIPLFIIGYILTATGFFLTQVYKPGSSTDLEIIWSFTGINVFVMTLSVFLIFKKINIKPSLLLSKIASLTFGIYLFHFFVVEVAYDLLYPLEIPVFCKILLIAAFTFVVSGVVIWLFTLNKYSKKLVE